MDGGTAVQLRWTAAAARLTARRRRDRDDGRKRRDGRRRDRNSRRAEARWTAATAATGGWGVVLGLRGRRPPPPPHNHHLASLPCHAPPLPHLPPNCAYSPLLRNSAPTPTLHHCIAPSPRQGVFPRKPVFLVSIVRTLLPIFRDKQITRKVHDIRFRARIEKIDKPRTSHNRHDLLFLVVHNIVHLLMSDRFVLEHDFMPTRSEAALPHHHKIVRLFRPKCKPAVSTNNSIPPIN
jgi:hypothetical protein